MLLIFIKSKAFYIHTYCAVCMSKIKDWMFKKMPCIPLMANAEDDDVEVDILHFERQGPLFSIYRLLL